MSKNYYEVLGVSKDCSENDIKKAFKKQSLKWHPDRWATGTDEEKKIAEDKFKEINEANSILSDPQKRKNYDMFGDPNGRPNIFDGMDMDDFFNPFGRRSSQRINKGENAEVFVNLSLEEIFNGGAKTIKYFRKTICKDCNGTGLAHNGKREFCSHCNGSGRIRNVSRNGYSTYIQESMCPHCNGVGQRIINPCTKCNGSGLSNEECETLFTIPAGVPNGSSFVMEGAGSAPYNGEGINGDLYIVVREIPHKEFKRSYNDIHSDIEINIVDALCGCEVTSNTIDGSTVKFNLGKLTKDGHTLKLSGKGMKDMKNPSYRGNHYITINYVYPTNLTEEQIKLLQEFNEIEKKK
jgi:molecular chaperone DnaJ